MIPQGLSVFLYLNSFASPLNETRAWARSLKKHNTYMSQKKTTKEPADHPIPRKQTAAVQRARERARTEKGWPPTRAATTTCRPPEQQWRRSRVRASALRLRSNRRRRAAISAESRLHGGGGGGDAAGDQERHVRQLLQGTAHLLQVPGELLPVAVMGGRPRPGGSP